MITKDDDFETRAIEVLFNGGDENLITTGEMYQLYDTVTEYVKAHFGEYNKDYHFTGTSLPQNKKQLQ
jgi:hypothetical protein